MAGSNDPIRQYARLGAGVRLQQLEAERQTILRAFPDLRSRRRSAAEPGDGVADGRSARVFTAAQRKAISDRMKKTWAERRRKAGAE